MIHDPGQMATNAAGPRIGGGKFTVRHQPMTREATP